MTRVSSSPAPRLAFAAIAVLGLITACPVDSNDDIGETTGDPTTTATTTASTTMTTDADSSESGSAESSPMMVDFQADLVPLFTEHCVEMCHEPGGTWYPFLDMQAENVYTSLLEDDPTQAIIPYVTPGEPTNSYILYKVRGTATMAPGGGSGVQMPQALPPLTEAEIGMIEAWIEQGAPE